MSLTARGLGLWGYFELYASETSAETSGNWSTVTSEYSMSPIPKWPICDHVAHHLVVPRERVSVR